MRFQGYYKVIKMSSYQHRYSNYKDKIVLRLQYLYNGNIHTWKDGPHLETAPNLNLVTILDLEMYVYPKRKCHYFDEIFVTGCIGSCQNDNFQCSQWWKFCQNDISCEMAFRWMSVYLINLGSGNDLMPSSNKPLPEPMMTQISVGIWHR